MPQYTIAWMPGDGVGNDVMEAARIVLDAIDTLKTRSDIDAARIGLWGISQAGYVMPRVLAASSDVATTAAASGHQPCSSAASRRYHLLMKPTVKGTPMRLIAPNTNAAMVQGMRRPMPASDAIFTLPVR